jgi:hypothetical protein
MFLGWNGTDRIIHPVSLSVGKRRFVSPHGTYDLIWRGEDPYIREISAASADETVSLSFIPPLPGLNTLSEDDTVNGEVVLSCSLGCTVAGTYVLTAEDEDIRYLEITVLEGDPVGAVEFTSGPFKYTGWFTRSDSGWYRESRWYTSD